MVESMYQREISNQHLIDDQTLCICIISWHADDMRDDDIVDQSCRSVHRLTSRIDHDLTIEFEKRVK